MIDLNSLVQSAQGGNAIDNIARRFGLTPEQAESAVGAVLPAIRMGLQNAAGNGQAGAVLGHLADPAHQGAFGAPAGAPPELGTGQAGSILGSLFGSHQAASGVAQQAAAESGVSASVIQAMLPMIVSMVLGGLAHGAQTGAFGGALSSILGSIFGGGAPSAGSGYAPAPSSGEGGLGGLIGSVLGGLLGGGAAPSAGTPAAPEAAEPPPVPAGSGATADSVLDEISGMIRTGPTSPEHESRLASILGR